MYDRPDNVAAVWLIEEAGKWTVLVHEPGEPDYKRSFVTRSFAENHADGHRQRLNLPTIFIQRSDPANE